MIHHNHCGHGDTPRGYLQQRPYLIQPGYKQNENVDKLMGINSPILWAVHTAGTCRTPCFMSLQNVQGGSMLPGHSCKQQAVRHTWQQLELCWPQNDARETGKSQSGWIGGSTSMHQDPIPIPSTCPSLFSPWISANSRPGVDPRRPIGHHLTLL